jgi:hypothetical protein
MVDGLRLPVCPNTRAPKLSPPHSCVGHGSHFAQVRRASSALGMGTSTPSCPSSSSCWSKGPGGGGMAPGPTPPSTSWDTATVGAVLFSPVVAAAAAAVVLDAN